MSILSNIKKGVANSGSNKGKVLYFKDGSKLRIRFLAEIEDGVEITQHDKFDDGINFFDQEIINGEAHELQEDDSVRHRTCYIWPVWDYDAKEVKIFIGYANKFSPLPALVGMYESYGTIMDRDYVISRSGSQLNTSYTVVPMDKVKFKNSKAKALSEKKILSILDKAFPAPGNELDVDDEDDKPAKKSSKKKGKKKKPEPEPEEDEDDEDEETGDYSDMSAKELYMECIERGIKAKKKKKAPYYIDLLEEYDEEQEDEDEDEDDWEDEDDDEEDDW
jgi:hypothetical protein